MKGTKATELKSTTHSHNHTQNLTQSKLFTTSWPSRLHYPSSHYCLLSSISTSLPFIPISTQTRPHGEHNNPHPAHRLSSLTPTKSWILPMSPLLGSYTPILRENTTIAPNDAAINSWFPTSTGLLKFPCQFFLSFFTTTTFFVSKPWLIIIPIKVRNALRKDVH